MAKAGPGRWKKVGHFLAVTNRLGADGRGQQERISCRGGGGGVRTSWSIACRRPMLCRLFELHDQLVQVSPGGVWVWRGHCVGESGMSVLVLTEAAFRPRGGPARISGRAPGAGDRQNENCAKRRASGPGRAHF